MLQQCGFVEIRADVRYPKLGVEVSYVARDGNGKEWAFDVSGGFTSTRTGLSRSDALWKALAKAAVLHEAHPDVPLVLLTTDAPPKGSAGHAALRAVSGRGKAVHDVIELLDADGHDRLRGQAR